jgi:hypothetical protein
MANSFLNRTAVWIGLLQILAGLPAQAILFYSTDDPTFNSIAPGGSLTNSGWQYQGQWGGFLGTPIAPRYFITAEHIGGAVGQAFVYQGISYPTTAVFDDSESDLRVWRVCGSFPMFAPLYTNRDEVGKDLVVFGRGTLRGPPVTTTSLTSIKTNGWLWGSYDGVERWGENQVAQIADGGTGFGELLAAEFQAGAGPNECHLSVGDSAGGLFIKDGALWKLAGINYAVDGPYNTTNTGVGFNAAIFDEGGLYLEVGTNWVLTPDLPIPQPGSFYATRISSRVDWINSVLATPFSGDAQPTLLASTSVEGSYTPVPAAIVDDVSKTITIPQPSGTQFFQLQACTLLRIASILIENGNLILAYE